MEYVLLDFGNLFDVLYIYLIFKFLYSEIVWKKLGYTQVGKFAPINDNWEKIVISMDEIATWSYT